jgi:ATP-binding cassette, subfamily B, bacterial MsbA
MGIRTAPGDSFAGAGQSRPYRHSLSAVSEPNKEKGLSSYGTNFSPVKTVSGILPTGMREFLLRLWGLTRPYRGRLLLGVVTGIISGLIEPLMIATVMFVYGLVFPDANAASLQIPSWAPDFFRRWMISVEQALATGVRGHPAAVIILVGAIPAVMMLRSLFSYLNVYLLQWAAIRTITDLRVRLFSHLMDMSACFFSRTTTGELMSRIMSDTGALQNILSSATTVVVKDPVTVIGLLAYLLYNQPKITFISMIVMPCCMLPIIIFGRKIRRSSRAMQTHAAELGAVMSEALTGHRIVKAYNLESTVVSQFRETAGKFVGHYMRIVRSSEIPGPLLETFGAIGVALVLLYLAMQTGALPSSKAFLAVIASIFTMYRPLKNLTRLHNNLEQARAASENVFRLLSIASSVPEPAAPKPLRAAGARIEFDHVHFSYGEKTILQGVSLTIEPGQLIALVGASGSGKTTLTNLLLRFYDPQGGAIRIGGVDLREMATRDLRNQIAVVTQETVLFNQTIYRNIELGRPGASREEIYDAARHAHAYDFILDKPKGFDTVVGEKGVTLSGGQRQRIAIARAILKNAPILVLDEATSSLDTESERVVQAALEDLMQGRTTICIAHRLSTIQQADLIVVLEKGRIIEVGRHADLAQAGGMYQKLHELSFEGVAV